MRDDPRNLLQAARERLSEVEARCCDPIPGIAEVRVLLDEYLDSEEPSAADVLRILGHELKSPLSAMVALLSSVSDGYLDTEPVRAREMVQRARLRAEELLPLVDDILDLGTLASKLYEVQSGKVDLTALCNGVIHLWEPLITQKGRTLTGTIPPGPVAVMGSPSFLRRVVTNLIMNAFKYGSEGGRIDLSLAAEDGLAVIRVADDGIGIPPEDLPHIFEFLYRGRQARRNPDGGLGLGLSLVRQIVERHGGTITAESEEGKGTSMIVRIPLAGDGVSD
jgi:signal transduction histidine kinase